MQGIIRTTVVAVSIAAVLALCGAMAADADPVAAIKYRRATMQALAAHTKAAVVLIVGRVSYKGHLARQTASIASIASMIGDLFPEGSGVGDTRALPAIWERPDEFRQAVKAIESAGAGLAAAGKSGDMTAARAAFRDLAKACKGCHKYFRERKR